MKKRILGLFVFLFISVFAMAQERIIKGTITGKDDGLPLPGVSVKLRGTKTGTLTNADGKYSINVPGAESVLEFSYIGFETRSITVGSQNSVNVVLQPDSRTLGEVVVVAYGQQTKKSITGSVASVSAEQIAGQKVVSVTQALQGVAPGVQIVNSIGQPGENPQIRIRGIGSINASASPLIVVDGAPFDAVNGSISSINPADIESVSVLKDATAASLYGSRASNGVILITTKTGKFDQAPVINFGASLGSSSRAVKEYPFVSTAQYMTLAWEALKNEGASIGSANPGQYASNNLIGRLKYNPYGVAKPIDNNGNLVPGASLLWDTNWSDELTRKNTYRQEYTLSVSGGTDKSKYYVGGSYLNQDGYTIQSNYKRINARINYSNQVTKWLELGIRSSISSSDQNYPTQSGSSFGNTIQYIRTMSSIYPVYQHDDKGALIYDINGQPILDYGDPNQSRSVNVNRPVLRPSNLVGTTNLDRNLNKYFLSSINVYGDFRIMDGLKFRTNYALDKNLYNSSTYQNPDFGDAQNVAGRDTKERDIITNWTWNNMLTYKKQFGDHSLEAMASMEAYKYGYEYLYASKTGYPFPGLTELTPGTTNESTDSRLDETTLLSYLARLSYNYKGKYFLEGTVRSDKSSKFAPNARQDYFPSIGGSWLMSEEDFLKKENTPVSFLKVRASYGRLGNNGLLTSAGDVDYFPYLPLYAGGYPDLGSPGILLFSIGNPRISWEKTSTANIGVDFGLFKDRLTGSFDFFNKNTTNLLFNRPLPQSGGIATYPDNVGSLRNRGFEVNLNSINVKTKDFRWQTGFNISYVKNKITSLSQTDIPAGLYKYTVGSSVYEYFIPEWAGVDPADGAPMWYKNTTDANGNLSKEKTKVYSDAQRIYMGSALPKFTGGGKIYDGDYAGLMHGFSSMGYQLDADILQRWQKPGDVTSVPALSTSSTNAGNSRSSRFLVDASYLRLRNVAIGYSLTPKMLNNATWFKSARLYIQADNALTWFNGNKGLDPEVSVTGATGNRSSIFKTYSFGLNVAF
eukprot:gene13211-15521_t